MTAYRRLLPLCIALAFVVIGFGAYVRLSDAGLACPDWPGCYGQLLGVPQNAADPARAWKEMIHRYLAGGLGLACLALSLLCWRWRSRLPPALPTVLVGVVAGQALLGMWTVTLLLKPLVVSAHLLGGMTILAILVWLQLREHGPVAAPAVPAGIRSWSLLTLLVIATQIALGAWVSSNYAALACSGFPACSGTWLPEINLALAFEPHQPLPPPTDGLIAIHWLHRLGALATLGVAGSLACRLLALPGWRRFGALLAMALSVQLLLGAGTVLLVRPLPLAVAHTLGAAMLLLVSCAIFFNCGIRSPLPDIALNPPRGSLAR